MSVEFLRRLQLFTDVPEADLLALWQGAEVVSLAGGEWLMREGESGAALYIVLEGGIEITKRSGNQDVLLARREAGALVGEMALLEDTPRTASVRAVQPTRLLKVEPRSFALLLRASPATALTLMRTVSSRLQSTEALLIQNEKMAALGTLAAGLAHELNNPAAAVQRSVAHLQETLGDWQEQTLRVSRLIETPAQAEMVDRLRIDLARRAAAPADPDPLTRPDREAELQNWLEAQSVEQAWLAAPALAALGYGPDSLSSILQCFGERSFGAVAGWMVCVGTASALLQELKLGADRMAAIVKAVRAYAYLDQAPVQSVDVHDGLENTLVILRHKLKDGVAVRREFAPDLPRIEAYGGELNQVWTNLIDNAIDAMQGQGELILRTASHGEHVTVDVCDSGPGIAPDILPRIFDPFFTTKPPGQGTGLGLHIAHSIVARHGGHISVTAPPAGACFRVSLPIRLPRGSP